MKEYKFIRVRTGFWNGPPKEDYHAIIEEHARLGWRLVQIFAPPLGSYGTAKFYELIFEKDKL